MKKAGIIILVIALIIMSCGATALIVRDYFVGSGELFMPMVDETKEYIIITNSDGSITIQRTQIAAQTPTPNVTNVPTQAVQNTATVTVTASAGTTNTVKATATPSFKPTAKPTATPTLKPTAKPTATSTVKPTSTPKPTPTPTPCPHSFGNWVVEDEATCQWKGSKVRECTLCGYEEWDVIPATDKHNYVNGACSVCGYEVVGTSNLAYTLSDDGTYYYCSGFKTVSISTTKIVIPPYYKGKPVKGIGGAAFCLNSRITEVVISDGIEWIGRMAFSATSIETITIPDSVNEIHGWAFRNCGELATVYINTTGWKDGSTPLSVSSPATAANTFRNGRDSWYTR